MNKCYLDRALDLICLHTYMENSKEKISDVRYLVSISCFLGSIYQIRARHKMLQTTVAFQHSNNKLHFTKAIKLETLIYPPDQGNNIGYIII